MSIVKINGPSEDYNYYKQESSITIDSKSNDIEIYNKILKKKHNFQVKGFDNEILINPISCKKIFSLIESDPREQILFSLYKVISNEEIVELFPQLEEEYLSRAKKNNNNELYLKNNSHNNNPHSISNLKNRGKAKNLKIEIPKSTENSNENNNINPNNLISPIIVENKEKTDSIFDVELPLLNKKRINDNNNKYNVNQEVLIDIYGVQVTKNMVRCFYLTLLICGIIDSLYIIITLIDKNKKFFCLFNIFTFLLSFLLSFTGLYGYIKINNYNNNNINFDNLKTYTILCFVCPLIDFVFARFSRLKYVNDNIWIGIIDNLVSSILGMICWIIINNIEEEKVSIKRNEWYEKVNVLS